MPRTIQITDEMLAAEEALRQATERYEQADRDRIDAIQAARNLGLPLRRIAEAAGLSYEWTRRIASDA